MGSKCLCAIHLSECTDSNADTYTHADTDPGAWRIA